MKLFFIHEVSYQEKVVFEMHEFPEILASRSHDVYFYDFPEKLKRTLVFSRSRNSLISGRVRPESKVHLISPMTFSSGIIQRILAIPYSLVDLTIKLYQIRPDVIVTYAVPTYGLQILLLGKLFKIPVIYRAIDVSHLIRESKLNYLVNILEGIVIKKSNFVSCNNTAMQNYVIARGAMPDNVKLNYAPVDFEYFKGNKIIDTLNLKNLLFLGTLFPFTGLEEFINTAHRQNLFQEGYTLTIVGSGERYEALYSLVKSLDLEPYVHLSGMVPYSNLSGYLSEVGITLNPFLKSTLTDIALPHKVIQYAASERAIVSTPLEGLKGLFDKEQTIFWAKNSEEIVERIREINKMSLGELEARITLQTESLKSKLDPNIVIVSLESLLRISKKGTTK